MKKNIMAFLKDEDGQTSTEYILLVAVVALIVFKFGGTAKDKLTMVTDNVFNGANTMADKIQQAASDF